MGTHKALTNDVKAVAGAASASSALQAVPPEMELLEELRRLRAENDELRQAMGRNVSAPRPSLASEQAALEEGGIGMVQQELPASTSSEGRLRVLMTSPNTTPGQLRQGIGAVEALLEEARRELAAKELRARRAAYEQLYAAMERSDEAALQEALTSARAAQVEDVDVQQGEARLATLRSLTSEQREARAARELEHKRKQAAFLLVKKDDSPGLEAFLEELEESVRWQEWRDYAGRTMWRCALELRSARAQRVLAPRLGLEVPEEPTAGGKRVSPAKRTPAVAVSAVGEAVAPEATATVNGGGAAAEGPGRPPAPALAAVAEAPRPPEGGTGAAAGLKAASPKTPLAGDEEERLKARALRAVAQDDCASLCEVLERTPTEVLSRWQNKAGKDLLTLSQERGSAMAYSVLTRALGLLKEFKREAFQDREDVWVFLQGEVQPRRATVVEDTPEEADLVLIEYWDGDDPCEHVERCLVRKMWS